jgi:hypothetical protein
MKTFFVLVGLLLLGGGIWWFWWQGIDRQLTEKPARSGAATALPATLSSIQANIVVPYTTIADAVTRLMPADFSDQGRQNVCVDLNETVQKSVENAIGGDVGKFIGGIARVITTVVTVNQVRHVCQDVDYRVAVHRDGAVAISLAPSGTALRLSVPISVSGEAGFSGDVAKALALDRKSFRGSILAFADVTADLGADWCPTVQVTPDFIWRDKAQLEVAGKVWINIDGTAGPKIKDALGEAARKIPEAISCAQFKASVTPIWHEFSWPINNGTHPLGYLDLKPKTVGFSGLIFQPDSIRTALALGVSTEVTTAPPVIDNATASLPPIERVPVTSDKLNISVPLRAEYGDLQAALSRLIDGQDFSGTTPAGQAHVRVKEVTVYPAGKRLVVGMQFAARFDSRAADVNGWVYVAAEPWLDESSQTLKLKNISYTRDLDNKMWSLLSAIFRGPIQAALEQKAYLDLKEPIKALRIRMKNDLAAASDKQGIAIALSDSFVGLKQINIGEKQLEIVVGLEGTADVKVSRIVELNR